MSCLLRLTSFLSWELVVSLLVALPGSVEAQTAPPPGWSDPYAGMQLSDQQRQQIGQYRRHWNTQFAHLQPQLRREQDRLVALLSNPQSDALEITQTQQRISSLQNQLSNQATLNVLQKRRLLTLQQRQQLRRTMDGMSRGSPGMSGGSPGMSGGSPGVGGGSPGAGYRFRQY